MGLADLFLGTGLSKEWVSLKQEGEKAPQIRLAHPATISNLKGTRKRRRDTAGNYSWAIGDHVDAWIKNRYAIQCSYMLLFHW